MSCVQSGKFYETVGFDACLLVEYAGLNPMGGTDRGTPRAGCPVANLRQTLDSLTGNGFSAAILEEVKAAYGDKSRRQHFIAGSVGLSVS